jgi:hypothetical protein
VHGIAVTATAVVIADTSPFVHLDRIGRLWILPAVLGYVTTPASVAAELDQAGCAVTLRSLPWVIRSSPIHHLHLVCRSTCMHAGEAAALTLALTKPAAVVLMDDREGRRVAKDLGLLLLGTGRLIGDAKDLGLIPTVRPVFQALAATGFRLGAPTVELLCRMAGE